MPGKNSVPNYPRQQFGPHEYLLCHLNKSLRWAMNPMSERRDNEVLKGSERETLCPATETSKQSIAEDEAFRQVAPGKVVCLKCGRSYKQLGALSNHLMKNHGIVDVVFYKCSKCGDSFNTQKQLTRHEETC